MIRKLPTLLFMATFSLSLNATPISSNSSNSNGINIVSESSFFNVEFSFFKAHLGGGVVSLVWGTESEFNNQLFEVEKSTDGKEFKTIGFIRGNGSSYDDHAYGFIDNNPILGVNHYRLKQVDFTGKYEYSSIVKVTYQGYNGNSTENTGGSVFPNPAKPGIVNLDLEYAKKGDLTISVVDMSGKVIKSEVQKIMDGQSSLRLDLSFINGGVYFIHLTDGDKHNYRNVIIRE